LTELPRFQARTPFPAVKGVVPWKRGRGGLIPGGGLGSCDADGVGASGGGRAVQDMDGGGAPTLLVSPSPITRLYRPMAGLDPRHGSRIDAGSRDSWGITESPPATLALHVIPGEGPVSTSCSAGIATDVDAGPQPPLGAGSSPGMTVWYNRVTIAPPSAWETHKESVKSRRASP
jgi:hypothetical protein